jgi:hypothetical protein
VPALSILADAPLGPWGCAQVRFEPQALEGGLRLYFEGEFPSRWEADLVILGLDHRLARLPLGLSAEGRGETAVPLEGVAEAWLLVRHLGSSVVAGDSQPRRYTYAVHRERDYPVELVALDAVEEESGGGVVISWDTASEQDVIAFDVLRSREDGGQEVAVNPVWIPALGDQDKATSYVYVDQTAEPGASYAYRILAVTQRGLTARSEPVTVRRSVR